MGISQLNEKDTIKFINENKIPNILFVVDDSLEINKRNQLAERYEMLLDDLNVDEYRKDPTLLWNVIVAVSFVGFVGFMVLISYYGYDFVVKMQKFKQLEREVNRIKI